jgi:hypothetical protein
MGVNEAVHPCDCVVCDCRAYTNAPSVCRFCQAGNHWHKLPDPGYRHRAFARALEQSAAMEREQKGGVVD